MNSFLENENQIILVNIENEGTRLIFYEKDENKKWKEILNSNAHIGKNGAGKSREGDGKTPVGIFDLGMAFGIKDNPRN